MKMNHTTSNLVAVYTAFKILEKMKHQLGLEAMLEYMLHYTTCMEQEHPQCERSVEIVLKGLSVKRLYENVFMGREKTI